jgi:hypothetical protein
MKKRRWDMESHTISGDTEPNTLNNFLLVDNATTDTILRDKKCFSYFGLSPAGSLLYPKGTYSTFQRNS